MFAADGFLYRTKVKKTLKYTLATQKTQNVKENLFILTLTMCLEQSIPEQMVVLIKLIDINFVGKLFK